MFATQTAFAQISRDLIHVNVHADTRAMEVSTAQVKKKIYEEKKIDATKKIDFIIVPV